MTHQEYLVDGSGPALVLLHGGLSNGDDFDAQLAELTARYRVWRPDRRGHGATPDVAGPITPASWPRSLAWWGDHLRDHYFVSARSAVRCAVPTSCASSC